VNPDDVEQHSCAVCGYVVDLVTFDDATIGWQHTAATISNGHDDHPVIAVPASSIRTNELCDFCTAPTARWELPAESYSIEELPGYNSAGGWGACDDCAAALRARDWNKIIYRAKRAFERRNPELPHPPREYYSIMYRELRKHVTGPLRLHAW